MKMGLINIGEYDYTLAFELHERNIQELTEVMDEFPSLQSFQTEVSLENAYVSDWLLPDLCNLENVYDGLNAYCPDHPDVWVYEGWERYMWEESSADMWKLNDPVSLQVKPDEGMFFAVKNAETDFLVRPKDHFGLDT